MKQHRLFRRLAWPGIGLLAAGVIVFALLSSSIVTSFLTDAALGDLKIRGNMLAERLQPIIQRDGWAGVQPLVKQWGRTSSARITVVDAEGTVCGDSQSDPELMDNHRNRPEVLSALRGVEGSSVRFSRTTNERMAYTAVPLYRDGRIVGVLRTAVSIETVFRSARELERMLLFAGSGLGVIAVLLLWFMTRRVLRPLAQLESGARRFAEGDLRFSIPPSRTAEFTRLAGAMNHMARQLRERFDTIVTQRNEREAVLSSMSEGVLAVDGEERLLSFNTAAAGLLGLDRRAVGREFREVCRIAELQLFLERTLHSQGEREIVVAPAGSEERFLHARGAPLRSEENVVIGAVVVLTDVTRIRKLERVRREFVANVSHELKTPVTSIKGFVETLLEQSTDPEESRRYLEIIDRQTDRLHLLVEDLLVLARIEEEEEHPAIPFTEQQVDHLIAQAVQTCVFQAEQKKIRITVQAERTLVIRCNGRFVETALVNLLQNALAYSPEETTLWIRATRRDDTVEIAIEDEGRGISPEHLPRLFERFYRVEKGRSRGAGGSGLGLSIVKHVMKLHKGRVTVSSTPGKGSIFTLLFPPPEHS